MTKHELLAKAKELGVAGLTSRNTAAEIEAAIAAAESDTAQTDVVGEQGPEPVHVPAGATLRPPVVEVDAQRLTGRPIGPFRGGIIVNSRNRCAICGGHPDHVHTREG